MARRRIAMNNTTVAVASSGNIVLGEGVHAALTVVIGTALPMGVLFELVIIVKAPTINDICIGRGRGRRGVVKKNMKYAGFYKSTTVNVFKGILKRLFIDVLPQVLKKGERRIWDVLMLALEGRRPEPVS